LAESHEQEGIRACPNLFIAFSDGGVVWIGTRSVGFANAGLSC
jgi:hypothetical protein